MKRSMIVICFILALTLTGCGGGGSSNNETATTAFGTIVDQNGAPVAGMKVTLGAYQTTSGMDGKFDLGQVTAGTYPLSVIGGETGHYITQSDNISITDGRRNNLGILKAYKVIGVGVIMQSSISAKSVGDNNRFIQKKQLEEVRCETRFNSANFVRGMSVNPGFLNNNVSFIYLNWDPVNESDGQYRIKYQGTVVWDSANGQTGDPLFDPTKPQAYLDLDDELVMISAPGKYDLQIVALAGDTEVKELPPITVSLGLLLDNYPTNINYTSGNHQLSWTGVAGANGYRVRVYDTNWSSLLFDSGATLLSQTTYDLSGAALTPAPYYLKVDAQVFDTTGWVAEITRGISGFDY